MNNQNNFIEVHSAINDTLLCLNVDKITAIGTVEKSGKKETILIIDGWKDGTMPVTETYSEITGKIFGIYYGQ